MTFITLFIIAALVAQCVLWVTIKHFRVVPEETTRTRKSLFREGLWWFIGTFVVLVLLGILTERVYHREETQANQKVVISSSLINKSVCLACLAKGYVLRLHVEPESAALL